MYKVVGVLAFAAVATLAAGLGLGAARGTTVKRVVVEQTLQLQAGRAQQSFRFAVRATYADRVRLVVTRGAAVSALARSADGLMGIGASTRPWGERCRHAGAIDVCDQPQEWCPLSDQRWRVVVRKASTRPARVRVRFVFVRA
jgi:hypothetical protein